jgi:hypothetical protein
VEVAVVQLKMVIHLVVEVAVDKELLLSQPGNE